MADRLLTVREVSDRLSLGRQTIYNLIWSGELSSLHIGRARRIPESAVEAFIAERVASVGGTDDAA